MPRSRQIAVIGDGRCSEGDEVWALAEEVGRRLAEAGCVVVCGGLGGVMEAASKGGSEAGGTVIGISPGDSPEHANDYCTHVVASSIGQGRNLAVVSSGEAVIAVGGAWGTLSEIGFAQKLGRPVIPAAEPIDGASRQSYLPADLVGCRARGGRRVGRSRCGELRRGGRRPGARGAGLAQRITESTTFGRPFPR